MMVKQSFLYVPKEKEIRTWYREIKKYKYGLEDNETIETFKASIEEGAVVKKDYGIYYLTNIHDPIGNAYGHCFFWDKRVKERNRDLVEMMEKAMDSFMLNRITVMIPAANEITARWLQKNGLEIEGYMRAYMVYRKQLYDMYIFAYYSKHLKKNIDNTILSESNTN